MRCCIVHSRVSSGGAGNQLLHLLHHWENVETEVDLYLLEAPSSEDMAHLPQNVHTISLMPELFAGKGRTIKNAYQCSRQLKEHITGQDYDVYLTFLWLPTVVALFAKRAQDTHKPLVWSVQSDLARDFRLHRDGWLRQRVVSGLLARSVDFLIPPSSGIDTQTRQMLGVPTEHSYVIPNAIDLSAINPDRTIVPRRSVDGPIWIVCVGRLHQAKGVDLLLDALSTVRSEGIEFECLILGDGPERAGLREQTEKLGLSQVVHFEGHVDNPTAWLREADLFVSPSRWETFGIAILEAMGRGLPVIATATSGAVDIITHREDGWLVSVEKPNELAEAIAELATNAPLRQSIASNAVTRAQHFDAPMIARQYRDVLHKVAPH